jgi:predicted DNA-binding transcriptional regulator AlpA
MEEITLRQAAARLGLSRQRVNELVKDGSLPSRLELTERGVARRLVPAGDVERLLAERQAAAARPAGKGRPVKLPEQ